MSTPSTGRRAAPRKRVAVDVTTVTGVAMVALAALLLLSSGVLEADPEPAPRASAVTVDRVDAACAAFPGGGVGQTGTVAAPLPATEDGGSLSAGPVGGRLKPQSETRRGVLQTLEVPASPARGSGSALALAASDAAAVGRGTFAVNQADGVLAVQECLPPRSRWWFTGGGAGLDHSSKLVMANLDPGPAVVDVVVHTREGVAVDVGTRGITLGPGETRTVDLLDVAPQADELAVHVEASRGRVVAALADTSGAGREWVPAQAEPSRVLRLAPVPAQADRHALVVANPSDRDALVSLRVADESGSFEPTDVPEIRVPAGSVVTADLTAAVKGQPSAVLLRSPQRITASVRSSLRGDISFAGPVPVLTGPAASILPEGSRATIQVTAGDTASSVSVTAYSADGEQVSTARLELDPTTTRLWTPRGRVAYAVLTPRQGRVFGGVALAGDTEASQVPLRPLPVRLARPVVEPVVH